MQRNFIAGGIIAKGQRSAAGPAEAAPRNGRGPTIGGPSAQPCEAGGRYPAKHRKGAAGCAPAHIAMAIMNARIAGHTISNLAAQASAGSFVGSRLDGRFHWSGTLRRNSGFQIMEGTTLLAKALVGHQLRITTLRPQKLSVFRRDMAHFARTRRGRAWPDRNGDVRGWPHLRPFG